MDGIIIQQALDDAALEQVLLDNFGYVLNLYLAIKAALGVDDHDRAECAQAMAAGLDDLDLVCEALLRNLRFQRLNDCGGVCGGTAGTAANQYMGTIHCFSSLLIWR